jgi:RimJ/RimL family protein N-acetyltransferase
MIETERLILRPFREADRDAFAALNADPAVAIWVGGPHDRAESDAMMDRINAHIAEHGFGLWAVERKADGRLLGFDGLQTVKEGALPVGPGVEIGWRLIPDAWGGGYATEGARAALAWGFANLDVAEILSFTAQRNERSEAVMRRIGMTRAPERDFDHPRLADDSPLKRHIVYMAKRPQS